nr:uncharacterized protein LOC113805281 [Penaeus vannamei]
MSQPPPPRKRSREESPARDGSASVRSSVRPGVVTFVGPRASPVPQYSQGSPLASTIKWGSEASPKYTQQSPVTSQAGCLSGRVNMPSPMYDPSQQAGVLSGSINIGSSVYAPSQQTPRSSRPPPLKRIKPRKLSLSYWNKGLTQNMENLPPVDEISQAVDVNFWTALSFAGFQRANGYLPLCTAEDGEKIVIDYFIRARNFLGCLFPTSEVTSEKWRIPRLFHATTFTLVSRVTDPAKRFACTTRDLVRCVCGNRLGRQSGMTVILKDINKENINLRCFISIPAKIATYHASYSRLI